MPRLLTEPPFPEAPGDWLWCYRYRGLPDGSQPSAEQLGVLLGVSGATVRRWESGKIKPTRKDLRRFAPVCGLTQLELEFILRCFGSIDDELAPSEEAFQALLDRCAASPLPTMVLDSLFYIRGWNSHLITMTGRDKGEEPNPNAIAALFDAARSARQDPSQEDPFTAWLRSFWLLSAQLCGTGAYRRLLEALRPIGDFEERWWSLALTQTGADVPVNLPGIYQHPSHGMYRIFATTMTLPPTYYVRAYAPIDETARSYVRQLEAEGPHTFSRRACSHWSEE